MPMKLPVINTSVTVNFTINICPTGNISSNNIGSNKQEGEPGESFQDLVKDIDIDDFFSVMENISNFSDHAFYGFTVF